MPFNMKYILTISMTIFFLFVSNENAYAHDLFSVLFFITFATSLISFLIVLGLSQIIFIIKMEDYTKTKRLFIFVVCFLLIEIPLFYLCFKLLGG